MAPRLHRAERVKPVDTASKRSGAPKAGLRVPHSEAVVAGSNLDYAQRAAAAIPGGNLARFSLPPDLTLAIVRGKGARVWDVEGREHLDFLMGSGPLILGHADDDLTAAIQEQSGRGSTFYALTPQIVELAEILIETIPCAELVKFTTSGSEAVEYALRVARAFTRRRKVLKFEGGYHGHSEYVVFSWSPKQSPRYPNAYPESEGLNPGVVDDVLVVPFNDLDAVEDLFRRMPDDIAAVIVEPVQRAIPPRPGFLEGLRDLTSRYGTLLVFDEILTGFRLALGGAQQFFGVVPDLALFGKAIASGYPLSVVAGRRDVMELFSGRVAFTGTFNGNALVATAALATLAKLRRPGVYQRLHDLGALVRRRLQKVFAEHRLAAQILGCGPWFQVVLGEHEVFDYQSYKRCDLAGAARLNLEVVRQSIVLNPTSKGYLCLAHSEDDIERLAGAYGQALASQDTARR